MPILLETVDGKVELDSILCSQCPRPTRIWPDEAMIQHQLWHKQIGKGRIFGTFKIVPGRISRGHKKHRPSGKALKNEGINFYKSSKALGEE